MQYPIKDKKEKPLFNYLVKQLTEDDYYLYEDFNDALRQAEYLSVKHSSQIGIYEPYFDTRRREFRGTLTFRVIDNKVFYDKFATPDLHLAWYLCAGEWLNPNPDWIAILKGDLEDGKKT